MTIAKLACALSFLATVTGALADQQTGKVRASDGPIAGATVTLYAAGTDVGADATLLGRASTGAGGGFSISYTPPDMDDAVLYLIADGPAEGVRLATVIGADDHPNTVTINERSTVATAYVMAQFIDGANIAGKSPGPKNAGAILRNLVEVKTGSAGQVIRSPPNGNRTSTFRTFNSLANVLSACVSGDIDCAVLFMLARSPEGDVPQDTLQATVNVARSPWQNANALFNVSLLNNTYHPILGAPPPTWTLALKYTGTGHEFDGPGAMAIDADGNVWANQNYVFRNNHSVVSCDSKLLSKLTPTGAVFPGAPYTGGGLSGAGFGITLDLNGDVWVGNFGFFGSTCPCEDIPLANSVSKIRGDGIPISPSTGFTQGCVTAAQATVCDADGNIWIANQCGGTVTHYRQGDPDDFWIYSIAGDQLIPPEECTDFSGDGPKPFAIAMDVNGNAWVSNNAGPNAQDTVFQLSPDGVKLAEVLAPQGVNRPMGVACDLSGNVWVSNSAIVSLPCAACDLLEDYGDLTPDDEAPPSILQLDVNGSVVGELRGGGCTFPGATRWTAQATSG